jgi:hypothetical protein
MTFPFQAETAQGLGGCASLLRNILRNEDSGLILKCFFADHLY